MATAVKPDQKKKKKEKKLCKAINEEFSTLAEPDEIVSHECFVPLQFKSQQTHEPNLRDNKENEGCHPILEKSCSEEGTTCVDVLESVKPKQDLDKEQQEHVFPTAPEISLPPVATLNITKFPIAKYPDLSTITNEVQVKLEAQKKLLPFTINQLKDIYNCREIENVHQFETEFLINSFNPDFTNYPLYQLLLQYSKVKSKLKINYLDLQNLKTRVQKLRSQIWEMKNECLQYSGVCGDNLTVTGTENYIVAALNAKAYESLSSILNQLQELVCFSYTANLVLVAILKLRIDQLMKEILSYSAFDNISSETEVLIIKNTSPALAMCISHLRTAISILFTFMRIPPPDKEFHEDVKKWIVDLSAMQLRVATWEDHMFLLFNILRCPNGASQWATCLLQLPNSNMAGSIENEELNHCIAFLSILLMPVKKRNEFLRAYAEVHKEISDPVKDDLWILVDSDGEEGTTSTGDCVGLKESDLIAFLNQVPFEDIFCSVLEIEKQGSKYVITENCITGQKLLKVIAFGTALTELLGKGLATYNSEKYKQFAKRLGRVIIHIIQHIADYIHIFMRNKSSKDPYLCERVHVEFDAFVLRSCSYIYVAKHLGTWQYFSTLPFCDLNINTMWGLFYYLNIGFPSDITLTHKDYQQFFNDSKFWDLFSDATSGASPDDLYYLLQAFMSMALGRDLTTDYDFIKSICSHIFDIGFINKSTIEICYKTSRDMIANVCSVYPELISNILIFVQNRNEIENCIYLFKSLPLRNWKPDYNDFEILSNWLLDYSYESHENNLSRLIIGHLNWGFDNENNLFIPHDIHIRMACLICKALNKHSPEIIGVSSISESVRQVANLIDLQTRKELFAEWCWNMSLTLRLHLMDQNKIVINNVIKNPASWLQQVPELEKIEIIFQGISQSRPLAMFFSVMISSWGHSVPLICQKGFVQLQLLLNDYRHSVVIRCLHLITPLFLDIPGTLSKCESFQNILKQIINSDKTYIKMAKDLISSSSPGPILEIFGNMIQAQIINYVHYGISTPTPVINMWLQCLTQLPNWQSPNIFYLVNLVLRIAYQFPDSWCSCKDYFRGLYKSSDQLRVTKHSALKMFWGNSTTDIFPAPTSDAVLLSLLNLELEHELYEVETNIWPEFLKQLNNSSGNTLDNILKKTASIVGSSTVTTSSLVLYKYAHLITLIPVNHPFLLIIWQQFFRLYLARIPLNEDEERFHNTFGVSNQFYEHNIPLMKKLKSQLKETEEYYLSASQKLDAGADYDSLHYFYKNCQSMVKSYILWLEETRINKISKHQNIEMPIEFNIEKLRDIFFGNNKHWTEFIYLRGIRKEQKDSANRWLKSCFRLHNSRKPNEMSLEGKKQSDPQNRIVRHLESYEKPVKPPEIIRSPVIIKPLNMVDINDNLLKRLIKYFETIQKSSKHFGLMARKISSLNGNYKDLLQCLYKNVEYQERKLVKCSSIFSKSALVCARAAEIDIQLQQPEKDEIVLRKIEDNRDSYNKLIDDHILKNMTELVTAMENIEHIIRYLHMYQVEGKDKKYDSNPVANISIQFFFHVINNMNEDIISFPSTNNLCTSILSQLGIFIQDNQETQGIKILETALKRPELLKFLSDLFVPSRSGPEYFINMYRFLIDSHMRRCDSKILFILLSKFDLLNWLQNAHPKLLEISQIINLIVSGLGHWNQPESSLIQGLLRRHLVHIFNHQFPEHYGEVLQAALTGSSEQKLMPSVLMDLMNSLLIKSGCDELDFNSEPTKIRQEIVKFATQQNLFNFKSITDTIGLLTTHFQRERFQHGLHGLYPKHKSYCFPLSIIFTSFGHAAVAAAVCEYPGVLSDEISKWLFFPICDMFSPWLIIYSEQNIQKCTANWIQKLLVNGKYMYPWSELHVDAAQTMILSFVSCIRFVLNSLPVSNLILGDVLSWYEYHFAKRDVPQHILSPIHNSLTSLPWNKFEPTHRNIESFYNILREFLPECHSFLGYIFLRVQWISWRNQVFNKWNITAQSRAMPLLIMIFAKIAFEPTVHENMLTSKIIEEILNLPWQVMDYQGIEMILNWFVVSVEPTIVLNLPSERNYVDIAILNLLKYASCVIPSTERDLCLLSTENESKKILYVRSMVRILRACCSKYQKLLETKDGSQAFYSAVIELINSIQQSAITINSSEGNSEAGTKNMMIELIGPLPTQSVSTSKLFIDGIIIWQSKSSLSSPVIYSILNAIGSCKTFINTMYPLLEETIFTYFKHSVEDTRDILSPSWHEVLKGVGSSLQYVDFPTLINGPYLLSLHIFIVYKYKALTDYGHKITFLQDLCQLLETVKPNIPTESQLAIIWGIIIACGCKILEKNENAKKPLLMLARYLHAISTQSEGWSEGLLAVIGLKKDNISNRRKVLTRCLSCLIFSFFPNKSGTSVLPSQEYLNSLDDLKNITVNKKFIEIKYLSDKAIEILDDVGDGLNDRISSLCKIISLFYNDVFVNRIQEFWIFT